MTTIPTVEFVGGQFAASDQMLALARRLRDDLTVDVDGQVAQGLRALSDRLPRAAVPDVLRWRLVASEVVGGDAYRQFGEAVQAWTGRWPHVRR